MLWTTKSHIKAWNSATRDWHTPKVKIDLIEEGYFRYRMAAKDGSESFDFEGFFDIIDEPNQLSYTLTDGRKVDITFKSESGVTAIVQRFQQESQNSLEDQKKYWQAILDNFKNYAEDELDDDQDVDSKSSSFERFKNKEEYK